MKNANKQLKRKKLFESQEFVAQYNYVKDDLGVGYEPEQTTFKVWAPTAEKVTLNLYSSDFGGNSAEKEESDLKQSILMNQEERGVWSTQVSGDLDGVYYTYSVQVEGISKETADPYARACGVNGKRSMVVDMKRTEPAGWKQDKRPEKIDEHPVIYELHIKDFSSDVHSGIKQEWRGKYLAFTQNDTSYDNEGKIP
ncbi:MAG: type I pullulanase, partial [Lachnospiraceae bacterium]|nr:type I pullulanase [Lachnospiraceae bacterium]